MNVLSGDHKGKCAWMPAGAVKMGWPFFSRLPTETNIGSPGPGVWYTSREPSGDQSNSATPSRYGVGCPPNVGTAQTLMSPSLEALRLRTQNVTREPSGENPRVRTDGLTSSGWVPWVRLWNWPEPTCVTQTSICPSRSDRNATNCPSRDTAAACSTASNSVTVWNCAPAMGSRQKYSVLCHQTITPTTKRAAAAASGKITLHRGRDAGTGEGRGKAKGATDRALSVVDCITRRLRPRAHASNSAVNA